MSNANIFSGLLLVFLLLISGWLTAVETAFIRMRRSRIEVMLKSHNEQGDVSEILAGVLGDRLRFLSPLFLLQTGVRIASVIVALFLIPDHFGNGAIGAALAAFIVLFFVVTEAWPNGWVLRRPEEAALRLAKNARLVERIAPLRWMAFLLMMLVERLMPRAAVRISSEDESVVSEEELLAVADHALASHAIDEDEHDMIESVIAFGDTLVREVMVPRPDMVVLGSEAKVEDAVALAVATGHSRLPVMSSDIDNLAGAIHAKDLLRCFETGGPQRASLTDFVRPLRYVPETKAADELLREMQVGRFQLVVVVDEHGATAGLVTMEDLLEEMVGEIIDEFDHEGPLVQHLAGGGLRVQGQMPVDELNDLLEGSLPEGEWETVGGLVFDALGHVPEVNEHIEIGQRIFTVEEVVGRRIMSLCVTEVAPVKISLPEVANDE